MNIGSDFLHTIDPNKEYPSEGCVSSSKNLICDRIDIPDCKKEPLPKDYVPKEGDVICGKGKKCYNHFGNRELRRIARLMVDEYSASTCRHDKSYIISSIVAQIRSNGGFVKEDPDTGHWYEVGDFAAREKISQLFRDALQEKYKSSTAFKRKKRQAMRKLYASASDEEHSKHLHIEFPLMLHNEPEEKHPTEEQDQQIPSEENPLLSKFTSTLCCGSAPDEPFDIVETLSSSLSPICYADEDPLEPIPVSQAISGDDDHFCFANGSTDERGCNMVECNYFRPSQPSGAYDNKCVEAYYISAEQDKNCFASAKSSYAPRGREEIFSSPNSSSTVLAI